MRLFRKSDAGFSGVGGGPGSPMGGGGQPPGSPMMNNANDNSGRRSIFPRVTFGFGNAKPPPPQQDPGSFQMMQNYGSSPSQHQGSSQLGSSPSQHQGSSPSQHQGSSPSQHQNYGSSQQQPNILPPPQQPPAHQQPLRPGYPSAPLATGTTTGNNPSTNGSGAAHQTPSPGVNPAAPPSPHQSFRMSVALSQHISSQTPSTAHARSQFQDGSAGNVSYFPGMVLIFDKHVFVACVQGNAEGSREN